MSQTEPDKDLVMAVERWSSSHDNMLPQEFKRGTDPDELYSCLLGSRYRSLKRRRTKLTIEVVEIMERIEKKKRVNTSAGFKAMQENNRTLRHQEIHCEDHRKWVRNCLSPEWQEGPEPKISSKGCSNPYPGLCNLGNTCYINAVLQSLLHCGSARRYLMNMTNALQEKTTNDLRRELSTLVRTCFLGQSSDDGDKPMAFDTFSPHAFLDMFINGRSCARPPFTLCQQHDACEAFEEILDHTGMGKALFNTGSWSIKEGIVMLDELVTHDFIETFLVGQDSVLDMNRLLPDLSFVQRHNRWQPNLASYSLQCTVGRRRNSPYRLFSLRESRPKHSSIPHCVLC
jgi:ubiquitin C-terminal hydrolase